MISTAAGFGLMFLVRIKGSGNQFLIGLRTEMTKPEAKRKLRGVLEAMDINTEAYLYKATNPSEAFQNKVTWWEQNILIMCKPSSANIPYVIKKHLISPFGNLPVDMLTEQKIQEWVSGLHQKGKLAPRSIHNVWKILRLILGKKHTSG